MKPWQRIAVPRPNGPADSRLIDALDFDGDSRGAFDDLRRALGAALEREPGSPLLIRSSLELLLGAFITRAQQRRGEIGLVVFELESWKPLQESAGARELESAFAKIGQELRRRLRASDDVGRLGEAQIAAILPGCEEQSLGAVAERLRLALESFELSLGSRELRPSFAVASIAAPLGPSASAEHVLQELTSALDRVRGAGHR